jgi:CRP-like cAMP-binding protein
MSSRKSRVSYPAVRFLPDRSSGREAESLLGFFRTRAPLFRRVPEAPLRALAQDAVVRRFARGEYVCHTGDPAREVWVVLEGRLCVNQRGWKGRCLSLEVMVPGDVSGLAAVACSTYPGEVMAMQETRLAAIPRDSVMREVEAHPVLGREILYAYGQRIHYIESLLMLSREPVRKRLSAALLYLYHKFGADLPLNRKEVGAMAGTTPETTMRVLKAMEREGILDGQRHRVAVRDLARLRGELQVD